MFLLHFLLLFVASSRSTSRKTDIGLWQGAMTNSSTLGRFLGQRYVSLASSHDTGLYLAAVGWLGEAYKGAVPAFPQVERLYHLHRSTHSFEASNHV